MSWPHSLRAAVAALGAYHLAAGIVLAVLLPFQFSLPRFGTIGYPEILMVLGVLTAVGSATAAAVAFAFGGIRALALIVIVWAATAVAALAPFLREGPRAWIPPSDISGLMPATVLAFSELIALPALLIGALSARFLPRGTAPPNVLEAAGAYYLTAVAMSLPTPQLDIRLTLPFTATVLPLAWHVIAIGLPALVAGLVLADHARPLWRAAAIGALLGLAAALPGEIPMLTSPIRPYWPVSVVGVPAASAAIVVAAIYARRRFIGVSRPRLAPGARVGSAALAGAAAAFLAMGMWSVLAAMPNSSDRDGPIEAFQRTGDERKIVACVMSGRNEQVLGSSAREDGDIVAVNVRLRRPPSWYFSDLVGILLPVIVTLNEPLGSRTVIDVWNGQEVRELSRTAPSQFASWC